MEALLLTLRLASISTAILIVLALPIAGWIALSSSRARYVAEAVIALPLVLPPTVLGFYLLVGLGPTTALGRTITAALGHTLAFSFTGLVFGSILYSLPFAVQPIVAGLRAVDAAYLEAAATLGRAPIARFTGIALPLAKGSILTAAVLTFTHTVGEFGVVLMLGGSIPGRTKTMSIALLLIYARQPLQALRGRRV
jgi:molybdate transport system permease protein